MDALVNVGLPEIETHRRLIADAVARLSENGKLVTTCTIQTALRQYVGVELTLLEIIDARRPR
jgi:hypothetical protein